MGDGRIIRSGSSSIKLTVVLMLYNSPIVDVDPGTNVFRRFLPLCVFRKSNILNRESTILIVRILPYFVKEDDDKWVI